MILVLVEFVLALVGTLSINDPTPSFPSHARPRLSSASPSRLTQIAWNVRIVADRSAPPEEVQHAML